MKMVSKQTKVIGRVIINREQRYKPGEPTIGRMAGTGTAVGGTGTRALGCQLRWRFFGGPEFIAEDTDHPTETGISVRKGNADQKGNNVKIKEREKMAYQDCLLNQECDSPAPEEPRRLGVSSVTMSAHQHPGRSLVHSP